MDAEFEAAARKLSRDRSARKKKMASIAAAKKRRERAATRAKERFEAQAEEIRARRPMPRTPPGAPPGSSSAKSASPEHYDAVLKAYPIGASAETDRIALPPSALEAIEKSFAVRGMEIPRLLTFSVSLLVAGENKCSENKTHAGVADFNAPEGSVGIPLKVASSLTSDGNAVLPEGASISVRWKELPKYKETFVSLRPLGLGFHKDGDDVVQIDVESLLLRALARHATLSVNDVIPVRHDGCTFLLRAETVKPETSVVITDTDLTVDILPSEAAAIEQAHKERVAAAADAGEKLPPQPPAGAGIVEITLRLGSPGTWKRRFASFDRLARVFDWIETSIAASVEDASMQKHLLDRGSYSLVQAWIGHKATFGADRADASLADLGLSRPRLALGVEIATEASGISSMDVDNEDVDDSEWARTFQEAVQSLDERIMGGDSSLEDEDDPLLPSEVSVDPLKGDELISMFKTLVSAGVETRRAAAMAQKWGGQLKELMGMGFSDFENAFATLEKYKGRIVRVVNALSSM